MAVAAVGRAVAVGVAVGSEPQAAINGTKRADNMTARIAFRTVCSLHTWLVLFRHEWSGRAGMPSHCCIAAANLPFAFGTVKVLAGSGLPVDCDFPRC